jgi:hypothetical protein
LVLNLKKLQSIARRRLNLKGQVEFKPVSKSYLASMRIDSLLSTATNSLTQAHTVSYSDASSLKVADVYHELCKAKLNEIGFTTIESASLNAMRDCCKNEPKYIRDASSAETIVVETYANASLFKAFPEESSERRNEMVLRFESSDALTSLRTQLGFWGTAAVCYYREASKRAGISFPDEIIERAIERALNGSEMKKEYDAINARLGELSKIDAEQVEERISDEDSVKIIEVIVGLFSDGTSLEC